jgi:predicted HicB family RNase H-like nuclease
MSIDKQSKVLSLRVTPELYREVKLEAARRGMKLNHLFEEIFRLYQKTRECGGRKEAKDRG